MGYMNPRKYLFRWAMTLDVEKIIKRIDKLKALGTSSYVHEANSANRMAAKLYDKHRTEIETFRLKIWTDANTFSFYRPPPAKNARTAKPKRAKKKAKKEPKRSVKTSVRLVFNSTIFPAFHKKLYQHFYEAMDGFLDKFQKNLKEHINQTYGDANLSFGNFFEVHFEKRAAYDTIKDAAAKNKADQKIAEWLGVIEKVLGAKGECTVEDLSDGCFVLQPWGYKIALSIEDPPKVGVEIIVSRYNKYSRKAKSNTFADMLREIGLS